MEPATAMSASSVTTLQRESTALRARRLAAARRRATALLLGATALFVGVTAVGVHGTFLGYVQAAAEASMVGGVADWFAVTALFRRPLGLPIPHTALIVERKDQFAGWPPGWPMRPTPPASPVTRRIWWSMSPRLSATRMSSACSPTN